MPQDLQQRYFPTRRVGRERRGSPRYAFTATCDATEPKSGAKIVGRTSDLGRGGCYIDTIGPFPPGTNLVVRINRDNQTLRMAGKVIFAQPGMGMGLAFSENPPDQKALLEQWIAELSGEPVPQPVTDSGDSAGSRPATAPGAENSSFYVVNELILLLLQKGVLTEPEGKALLQKLLK